MTARVFAARRPHIDHRMIFELVGGVKKASTVIRADHHKLSISNKRNGGDELGLFHFVP